MALPLVARANKKTAGELWSGEAFEKPAKGSIVVGGRHVRLRKRITPKEITVLSRSNDNQTFTLWVVMPLQNEYDYQYVKADGQWWASNGTGRDHLNSTMSIELDRASALRIAEAFGIPVHERTKLDADLRYTWKFPAKVPTTSTDPIPVVLRVDNTGKTTVGISIGGRQRGARDNRFEFAISRNGKPVAIKDAPDFGGLMTYHAIKPGEHVDITCADLRLWVDLSTPGYYTIDAKYGGELVKDGKMPNTAEERARMWDITAPGQASILVQ